MAVHTFDPSKWDAETGNSCEFQASLVYGMSYEFEASQKYSVRPNLKTKAKLMNFLPPGVFLVLVTESEVEWVLSTTLKAFKDSLV